jgi:LacI family transcriptional regulator
MDSELEAGTTVTASDDSVSGKPTATPAGDKPLASGEAAPGVGAAGRAVVSIQLPLELQVPSGIDHTRAPRQSLHGRSGFPAVQRSIALSRRVTITDVAKECGVTAATVSRVLNGKESFSASVAVRNRIMETAQRLGYVPDLAARSLNRQSTRIIGVFASPETHLGQGINESLFEGLAEVLHAGDFEVFFELAAVKRSPLPFWRFDGAILLQSPRPDVVKELGRRKVPYVCVNEQVGTPLASVLADDAMGMRRAVEHLASLGHKKIAYANARATYLTHHSVTDRYETFLAVARERGLELARGHDMPLTSALEFLRTAILTDGATALVTYDHHIAVMMVGAAYQLGLRIPNDFSMMAFNDVFPVALLGPPLSVISVSGREMGRVGAEILLNGLVNAREGPPEIRIPEDLILRASTSAPPPPPPPGPGRANRAGRS